MKVILLAAGRSRRMAPIEDKNFLNFVGKPLIQHQLEMLRNTGFDNVVVVGGRHNLGKIQALGEGLRMNVEICEQKNLEMGMCGAVLAAKDLIADESILIFSSNDVVDVVAFELIKKAAESDDAEGYILGKKVEEYFPGGYLETYDHGYIHNIVEKPEPGSEPSDLINLVVHLYKSTGRLMEYLEKVKSEKDDLYELALSEMMKDGIRFKAVSYEGFWQPIKFPWHVYPVFRHLFELAGKGISKTAQVAENAIINGDVIIGENVKIFDGAVVNGPAYIGDGSIVATNALVRDSNVGQNCVVGFGAEVARSFLGNDVRTHSNYIGDSVIGNNVSFGAGTVTGNLRLDEKNVIVRGDNKVWDTGTDKFGAVIGNNVRVGVNTSIMPGVKIGADSFVGAGIVVSNNIPPKSFARGKWEIQISENRESIADIDR